MKIFKERYTQGQHYQGGVCLQIIMKAEMSAELELREMMRTKIDFFVDPFSEQIKISILLIV